MKKNAMLKIAAILLVAVLLTTCAISSTFAKYVTAQTTAEATTARVAKWNVVMDTEIASDLKEANLTATEDEVELTADPILVAPGSSNIITATTAISGTAEVDFKVVCDAEIELAGWALANSTMYMPLTFKVNGTDVSIEGLTTLDDIENKLETEIEKKVEEYSAGATIDEEYVISISWAWAFGDADTNAATGNDEKDTYLGNNAESNTISVSVKQTAVQLD